MSTVNIRIALETALDAIAPIIPAATIATSSIASATVITTTLAHGLTTGTKVTIAGHAGSTPNINGIYQITVTSPTKFTIPVAVTIAGTGGTVTANLTARENVSFSPITGVPWQSSQVSFAQPDNPEFGAGHFQIGFVQVNVCYPLQVGVGAAATRAELIASTFKRGNTYTYNGTTVLITRTPQVMQGYPTASDYVIPVRIQFRAEVQD